jgi:hypothetical protein
MQDKNKFLEALRHPRQILRRILNFKRHGVIFNSKNSRSEIDNHIQFRDNQIIRYEKMTRALGFEHLYVLLSFDCDTFEDISAAQQLHEMCKGRGIKNTFAVPGTQLLEGANIYSSIAKSGAQFINHGYSPHAEWREGRYWPMTFYHEMSAESIIEDIQLGDKTCKQVLGISPTVFRPPHFGCIQKPEQWELIYQTIRKLDYRFSSSTLPELALESGPIIDMGNDIFEIPLSGAYETPDILLDSWSFVESPYNPVVKPEFAFSIINTIVNLGKLGFCGILNYYMDPAHVIHSQPFIGVLDYLKGNHIPTIDFNDISELIKSK